MTDVTSSWVESRDHVLSLLQVVDMPLLSSVIEFMALQLVSAAATASDNDDDDDAELSQCPVSVGRQTEGHITAPRS